MQFLSALSPLKIASGGHFRSIVTSVAVSDAVNYYFASARAAKLPAERRREGSDEVIAGTPGGAAYAVYVRQRSDGLTEVDLFTAGL